MQNETNNRVAMKKQNLLFLCIKWCLPISQPYKVKQTKVLDQPVRDSVSSSATMTVINIPI